MLVDNQLINLPILTLFQWDGKFLLPPGTLRRTEPIREAVLQTIEEAAPASNSYVFTNVLENTAEGRSGYERIESIAQARGSVLLAVLLTCDIEEQVRRIDSPDRVARLKGSDPEGYRQYTLTTELFVPPPTELLILDTTTATAGETADAVVRKLQSLTHDQP